jgi:hypothetical protein
MVARGMLPALLAALSLVFVSADARATPATDWVTLSVPTGGFSIDVPATWVHATTGEPDAFARLNKALHRTPAAGTRLVAMRALRTGVVLMDVAVQRPIGPATLGALAREASAGLAQAKLVGPVRSTPVTLPAGKAVVLRATLQAGVRPHVVAYVLYLDGLFYFMSYVTTYGNRDDALIERSARSLELVAPPDLGQAVLGVAQVGPGYHRTDQQNGRSVIGVPTLDLCDQSYPSEALRTARLQVDYTPPKGAPVVSNEVVTYVPGGARQALREVTRVIASCSRRPVVRTSGTTRVTFAAHPLSLPGLPAGAVAVSVEITAVVGKKREHQSGAAIYLVTGDTLSAVYTFAVNGATQTEANSLAKRGAQASDRVLRAFRRSA